MGNCFAFLKDYNKQNTVFYNPNNIPVTNVPIGTPIYFDISNNNTQHEISKNPNIIVINQQPQYYDNGLGGVNGFLTGMLMGVILSDDCL